jgi:hypothetical protein
MHPALVGAPLHCGAASRAKAGSEANYRDGENDGSSSELFGGSAFAVGELDAAGAAAWSSRAGAESSRRGLLSALASLSRSLPVSRSLLLESLSRSLPVSRSLLLESLSRSEAFLSEALPSSSASLSLCEELWLVERCAGPR